MRDELNVDRIINPSGNGLAFYTYRWNDSRLNYMYKILDSPAFNCIFTQTKDVKKQ